MSIKNSIIDLVGNTPLLALRRIEKKENVDANLIAKLEYFNPAGSVKDRVAKAIILDALEKGEIDKDTTLVEPTSGNTGIGLASVAAALGMKLIITMPETMSIERRKLMKAYGAELVLTDGTKGMKGAIAKANEIVEKTPNCFIPGQFNNMVNPKTHEEITGPEIWKEAEGKVDVFVAGEKNPDVKVIAVEPATSPVLSEGRSGPHKIQGIGSGFIPETLDTTIYDEVIKVTNEEAFSMGREIARTEGVLVGISSGAALWAAVEVAKRPECAGKNIVVFFPDTGDRYLSGPMFESI